MFPATYLWGTHRLDLSLTFVECSNVLSIFSVQYLGCALYIVCVSWAHMANVSGCAVCTWKIAGSCQYVPIHVVYALFIFLEGVVTAMWLEANPCKALTTPRTKATKATKHYH